MEDASRLVSDADLHSRLPWLKINHKRLCSKKIAILWHMQLLCCITIIRVTLYNTAKCCSCGLLLEVWKARRSHRVIVCMLIQRPTYTLGQRVCMRKARTFGNFAKWHCAFCRLTPVIGPVRGIANNDRNVLRNDTIRVSGPCASELSWLSEEEGLQFGFELSGCVIGHQTWSSCLFSCNVCNVGSSRGGVAQRLQ